MHARDAIIFVTLILTLTCPTTLATFTKHPSFIQTFSLADVDLHDDTDFAQGEALNHEYLLTLEADNLLYNFRTTAGLPAPGQSYGGWEGSTVEVRGQFIGHYLSALAFAYKSTGNKAFAERGDVMVQGLAECQAAWGDGYLAAFPKSFFERLESLQPVWAPYYVIHKIMAGLLNQHQLASQPEAMNVLAGMATHFCSRSVQLVKEKGEDYWHQVLETEFGGMNEVLYHLAMETGDLQWAQCAALFDRPSWFNPLTDGIDALAGLHANTHLAQVNGFAARFDATGDPAAAAAVANFFSIVTRGHSYSTGGSNWFERWGQPVTLGDAINNTDAAANTEESCTQYNILKIARSLFRWTGDARLADFYERAILNGVLGVQRTPQGHEAHSHDHNSHPHPHPHPAPHPHGLGTAALMLDAERRAIEASNALHAAHSRPVEYRVVSWPEDPAMALMRPRVGDEVTPGQYIYYMPLGHEGGKGDNPHAWTQGWGDRFNTFWCCYGTAVESFSKLADSIYFWRGSGEVEEHKKKDPPEKGSSATTPPSLFINQLVSSTLTWRQQGVTVVQHADLYSKEDNIARSKVTILVDEERAGVDGGSGVDGSEERAKASFFLHWRVPSWVPHGDLRLYRNSRQVNISDMFPSLYDFRADSFGAEVLPNLELNDHLLNKEKPPEFGKGARYLTLGPDWKDSETLEFEMPMRVRTEDLNDARKSSRSLKAVIMGPFHMAGITEGDRTLDVDPLCIEDAVNPPTDAPLVSFSSFEASLKDSSLEDTSPKMLLYASFNGSVQFQPAKGHSRAAAMAATFRVVPAMPAMPAMPAGSSSELVSYESMLFPGRFLSIDSVTGEYSLLQPSTHTEHETIVFSQTAQAQNEEALLMNRDDGHQPAHLAMKKIGARIVPAVATSYPKGARILSGKTKKYLVLPIGQVIDEHYTAYFEFVGVAPSLMEGQGAREEKEVTHGAAVLTA